MIEEAAVEEMIFGFTAANAEAEPKEGIVAVLSKELGVGDRAHPEGVDLLRKTWSSVAVVAEAVAVTEVPTELVEGFMGEGCIVTGRWGNGD